MSTNSVGRDIRAGLVAIGADARSPWNGKSDNIELSRYAHVSPVLYRLSVTNVIPQESVIFGLVCDSIVIVLWGRLSLSLPHSLVNEAHKVLFEFMEISK